MSVIEDVNTIEKEEKIGQVWPRLLSVLNELLCNLTFLQEVFSGSEDLESINQGWSSREDLSDRIPEPLPVCVKRHYSMAEIPAYYFFISMQKRFFFRTSWAGGRRPHFHYSVFHKTKEITIRNLLSLSPSSLQCKKLKHPQVESELLLGSFYVISVLSLDKKGAGNQCHKNCCILYHRPKK